MVERAVRTVKSLLTALCDTHLESWDQHLDLMCLAYNSTTHATTGAPPYFVWFGRPPPLPVPLVPLDLADSTLPQSAQAYRLTVVTELLRAYEAVRAHTASAVAHRQEQQLASGTMHSYTRGDLVWLHTPSMAAKSKSRKMHNPWQGPYLIMSMSTSAKQVTLLIPRPENARFQQVVSVARLRPYTSPLQQLWLNHGTGWKFPHSVYERRLNNGHEEFRVRWLALKPTADSWVDASSLPEHVKQSFWRNHRRPLPSSTPPSPLPPPLPPPTPTPSRQRLLQPRRTSPT